MEGQRCCYRAGTAVIVQVQVQLQRYRCAEQVHSEIVLSRCAEQVLRFSRGDFAGAECRGELMCQVSADMIVQV